MQDRLRRRDAPCACLKWQCSGGAIDVVVWRYINGHGLVVNGTAPGILT
ncbi:MAG: hypothetical protein IPN85_06375 [Flavobacteriales bacterium]|nr:hypothetical protein [Flavobacteriales bacterium]MBL0036693.1 hypothetical protein [Flavobacteriales bacterium]